MGTSGPQPEIGKGNAYFLADLANGITDEELRKRWKQGRYGIVPDRFVRGWRELAGRG